MLRVVPIAVLFTVLIVGLLASAAFGLLGAVAGDQSLALASLLPFLATWLGCMMIVRRADDVTAKENGLVIIRGGPLPEFPNINQIAEQPNG
jgi:hypothetical protein